VGPDAGVLVETAGRCAGALMLPAWSRCWSCLISRRMPPCWTSCGSRPRDARDQSAPCCRIVGWYPGSHCSACAGEGRCVLPARHSPGVGACRDARPSCLLVRHGRGGVRLPSAGGCARFPPPSPGRVFGVVYSPAGHPSPGSHGNANRVGQPDTVAYQDGCSHFVPVTVPDGAGRRGVVLGEGHVVPGF
jgi:hypothetical protein